jgi:hypothetical protein
VEDRGCREMVKDGKVQQIKGQGVTKKQFLKILNKAAQPIKKQSDKGKSKSDSKTP